MAFQRLLLMIFALLSFGLATETQIKEFSPDNAHPKAPVKASFSIKHNDIYSNYTVQITSVMPGKHLDFQILRPKQGDRYTASASRGRLVALDGTHWRWIAPDEPGSGASIMISDANRKETIRLNVFVLVPFNRIRNGYVNGYQIGHYPEHPLKAKEIYNPPKGFIEVTEANREMLVSPHYKLRSFVSGQKGGFPKYLVLRPLLLMKLEYLQEQVIDRGYRMQRFAIKSGYRTPFYNASIGDEVFSRHQWGGAVDVIIDENQDGRIDDLNGDGRITVGDAEVLYKIFDEADRRLPEPLVQGGLATYKASGSNGPFVHLDLRGAQARW